MRVLTMKYSIAKVLVHFAVGMNKFYKKVNKSKYQQQQQQFSFSVSRLLFRWIADSCTGLLILAIRSDPFWIADPCKPGCCKNCPVRQCAACQCPPPLRPSLRIR